MGLCGDGAFLMHGLEVHTAVEQQLPILFVVFNNQKHGMCVTRQQIFFDGREGCTSFDHVDISQIGRGLGAAESIWVAKATSKEQLQECLEAFHAKDVAGPGILELILPKEEIPPFTPFLDKGAETYVVPTHTVPEVKVRRVAGVS